MIYPKDLGAILMTVDIGPGQRVLEAGVGSGALSMTLLRAGANVIGYEIREDFATRAQANVEAALGPAVPYRVEVRDVTEGIDERSLDRILLDLPEPWRVLAHATAALRPGGFSSPISRPSTRPPNYVRRSRASGGAWPSPSRSCGGPGTSRHDRSDPDHRMVAHTGFLTSVRRLSP